MQLLTGAAGYALPGAKSDRHFLGLDLLPGTEREILRRSLDSKLFETPTERRTVSPRRPAAKNTHKGSGNSLRSLAAPNSPNLLLLISGAKGNGAKVKDFV